jgi:hypothetical protein
MTRLGYALASHPDVLAAAKLDSVARWPESQTLEKRREQGMMNRQIEPGTAR